MSRTHHLRKDERVLAFSFAALSYINRVRRWVSTTRQRVKLLDMEFSTFKVLRNNVVIQATLVICYSGNLLLYPHTD